MPYATSKLELFARGKYFSNNDDTRVWLAINKLPMAYKF